MPGEYDLIVSSKEKEMTDEEYIAVRNQYDKKIDELGTKTRKLILGFLGAYAVSFALLYIRLLFSNNEEYINSCYVLLSELMLAIFLYDPKEEENKKTTYEKDKRILLNAQKNKITAGKIRFGLVIGFGALFALLNIIWWAIFGFVPAGEASTGTLMLFLAVK